MRDIVAVTEKYTDSQGEEKSVFTKIGALGVSQNGKEYLILDPSVNIAGALFKQNLVNHAQGKPVQKSLMCSVFERQNNEAQNNNHAPQANQAAQNTQFQQQNGQNNGQQANINTMNTDIDGEIPF